jgi:alanine-glyoxylate transaminase/serine-glyoxylate transaminase/serine-pyruvate transaminase
MIPGPIELDPDVLAEMGRPLIAHYGPEWAKFYHETVELMKRVTCAERARAFLIAGPGTAAIDMAIGSVIGDGKKILVATDFSAAAEAA